MRNESSITEEDGLSSHLATLSCPSVKTEVTKQEKVIGVFKISPEVIGGFHKLDKEVCEKDDRPYLFVRVDFNGKPAIFAIPYRTNFNPNFGDSYVQMDRVWEGDTSVPPKIHAIQINKSVPILLKHQVEIFLTQAQQVELKSELDFKEETILKKLKQFLQPYENKSLDKWRFKKNRRDTQLIKLMSSGHLVTIPSSHIQN